MSGEVISIVSDSKGPTLSRLEKESLVHCLTQRINLLRRVEKSDKQLLAMVTLPISPEEVISIDKIVNPPSFFQRKPQDIAQEVRGILDGHFAICEKLSIINSPRFPMKRTAEEFKALQAEFKQYANAQLESLFPALKDHLRQAF